MNTQTLRTPTDTLCRGLETDHYFPGLPDGKTAFDLLRLVRDVGHELGLTGGDIQHLDYLISHTRDIDWQPGAQPIVYKSVCKMARERGISERQIHNRERKLHSLGCLAFCDLGNFRRSGCRDGSGRIVFAYGVNLARLGSLYDRLIELKDCQIADLAAFDKARRRLSCIRRRILVKIATAQDNGLDVEDSTLKLADLPRVRAATPACQLDTIISRAVMIEADLDRALEALIQASEEARVSCGLSVKTSDRTEQNFRHLQPTNNPQLSVDNTCNRAVDDDRDGVADPGAATVRSTGVEHIPLTLALSAAGDGFVVCIQPTGGRVGSADLVDAAARLCHHHGINRSAWADACAVMGRYAAAVAVLVIDRNINHPVTPIKSPGGVLRALTRRTRVGNLNLHQSLFGILDRDRREAGGLS